MCACAYVQAARTRTHTLTSFLSAATALNGFMYSRTSTCGIGVVCVSVCESFHLCGFGDAHIHVGHMCIFMYVYTCIYPKIDSKKRILA
jgi:hypothetical protein